jgi:hypothetical protein
VRSWDDIPEDQWIGGTIDFVPGEEFWTVEFDWMGLNGHIYHHPPEAITFDQFADIYEDLEALDIAFEVEDS